MSRIQELSVEDRELAERIKAIFDEVNNISATKTKKYITDYIDKLEKLQLQVANIAQESLNIVDAYIEESPSVIMKMLGGVYHCYYLSSFGYRIKREPFPN